eukprot:jgi/Tetstr1/434143/TSEL_002467.t1
MREAWGRLQAATSGHLSDADVCVMEREVKVASGSQKELTAFLDQANNSRLRNEVCALPVTCRERILFNHLDAASGMWTVAISTARTVMTPHELREVAAGYFFLPSPCLAPVVGSQIILPSTEHNPVTVDLYGDALMNLPAPGDAHWRVQHDAIADAFRDHCVHDLGIAVRREVDDLFQQAVPLGNTVPRDELNDLVPDAELSLPAFNVVTGSYDPRSLKSTLLEFKTMRYGVKYTAALRATAVDRFERSMLGDIQRGLAARDAAWHNTEPGQKGPLRDILDMSEYTGMVFGTVVGGSDDDDDDGDSRPWQMSWEQQDVSHRAPTATCAAVGGGHPYGGVTTSQTVAAIDGNARNDAVAEYIRQHATDMLRNVRRKCEQTRALIIGDSIIDDFREQDAAWTTISRVFDGDVVNVAMRGIRTQLLPIYVDWLFANSCMEPQVVYLAAGVVSCVLDGDDDGDAALYAERLAETVRIIKHYSPASQVVVQLVMPARMGRVRQCARAINTSLRRWIMRLPENACVQRIDTSEVVLDENGNIDEEMFRDKVHLDRALEKEGEREEERKEQKEASLSSSEEELEFRYDWLYSRWRACESECGMMDRSRHCMRTPAGGSGIEVVGDENVR